MSTPYQKSLTTLISLTLGLFLLAACGGAPALPDAPQTGGVSTPPPAPTPGDSTSPTPAPDLVFDAPSLELKPGEQASVGVKLDTGASLTGATFGAANLPAGIALAFAANSGGKSGVLTFQAAPATPQTDTTLAMRGQNADGSKAWVGSLGLRIIRVVATTRFVDPQNGDDHNAGTQAKPYKTLGRGLKGSGAGDTLKLLPGTYGQLNGKSSGDTFPVQVPNGVTIQGTLEANGARQSILVTPAGAVGQALSLAGDATLKNLETVGFRTVIKATQGKLNLNNIALINPLTGLDLSGTVQASVTNSYLLVADNSTAISINGRQAQLTLDGDVFEAVDSDGGVCHGHRGIVADDAVFHVNNTRFDKFIADAVRLNNHSEGDLSNTTFTPTTLSCGLSSVITVHDAAHLKLSQVKAEGTRGLSRDFLEVRDVAVVDADGLNVKNHHWAVWGSGNSTVNISNGFLSENSYGCVGGVFARMVVTHTTLTENDTGLSVAVAKLRDSSVIGNGVGVEADSGLVDLGGPNDPGNNTFANNALTSVKFRSRLGEQLAAVGNTWNPNTQLSDASGKYNTNPIISGTSLASGRNFVLDDTGISTSPNSIRLN